MIVFNKKIFVFITLFILDLKHVYGFEISKKIDIFYGEIVIKGFNNCLIESNGIKYIYNESIHNIPGLWFGLITYNCDNFEGTLISKPACKPCGIFCNYNEMIPSCKSYLLPIVLGVVIGVLSCVITALLSKKYIVKGVNIFVEYIGTLLQSRRDNKRYKYTKNNCKVTKITRPISFDNISKLANKDKIYLNRSNLKKKIDKVHVGLMNANIVVDKANDSSNEATAPEYIELNSQIHHYNDNINCNIAIKNDDEKDKDNYKKLSRTSSSSSLLAKALIIGAVGSVVVDQGFCCDSTLFMTSEGKVCDKTSCTDINMYNFQMQLGNNICFRDTEGHVMSFQLINPIQKIRYSLIYKTSSYSVKVDHHYSCKGAGECYKGGCTINSKSKNFIDVKKTINQYGCTSSSLGCDTWCGHQTACTWYHWWIVKDNKIANVYKMISKIWQLSVRICFKNICKDEIFNVNNPSKVVDTLSELKFGKMPLTIVSLLSEEYTKSTFILKDYNNDIFPVAASEINMPVQGLIGDYQISLDYTGYDLASNLVSCHTESCLPICNHPEPSIDKVRRTIKKNYNSALDNYFVVDPYTVELRFPLISAISMTIGNVQFDNLYLDPAVCEFQQVMSYGCIGCNIKPYLILETFNLKQEGIVKFETNCSFNKNYLSCSSEPFIIEYEKITENCMIFIPSLNKTMFINTKFDFLGGIDLTKTITATESLTTSIANIATSASFISSLSYTFGTCFAISTILAVSSRLLKLYTIKTSSDKTAEII